MTIPVLMLMGIGWCAEGLMRAINKLRNCCLLVADAAAAAL